MRFARLAYPLLALWGAAAWAVTPEDVATRISDARFETATTVLFEAKDGSDKQREVFLWVYQSRLGQILNSWPSMARPCTVPCKPIACFKPIHKWN